MAKSGESRPSHDPGGIERLLSSGSADVRVDLAQQFGSDLSAGGLSATARRRLVEVLDLLAHDLECQVRIAVADSLKNCPDMPIELAMTLASDVEAVAEPILSHAVVLDDAALLEIVDWAEPFRNRSVASRPHVSPDVCNALIETGDRSVVSALLQNDGAEIAEDGYRSIVDGYGLDPALMAEVGERPELPATIVDRLIGRVTDELRAHIEQRHPQQAVVLAQPLRFGGEAVLIAQLQHLRNPEQANALLNRLQREHRLTPTLLLHALAVADFPFFLQALGRQAGLDVRELRRILSEDGTRGADSVQKRTGYPINTRGLLRVAAHLFATYTRSEPRDDIEAYRRHFGEQLLLEFPVLRDAPLERMLGKLDQLFAGGAAPSNAA